jgi:hypothetical protein
LGLKPSELAEKRRLAFEIATRELRDYPALATELGITLTKLESRVAETLRMGPDVWDDVLVKLEEAIRGAGVAGHLPLEGEALAERLEELITRDAREEAWSDEDDESLVALVGTSGDVWCSIGLLLRRPPIECFRRWRGLEW